MLLLNLWNLWWYFQFYKSDSFGLKTLDEAGKIYIHEVPGVKHVDWHGDKAVFDNYIAPYLM